MSGTKNGGINAGKTNYARYGKDYYRRLGRLGGVKGHTGGFYGDSERAKQAGRKGSRRKEYGEQCRKGHVLTKQNTSIAKNGHLICWDCVEV